jgi:hypothetical protein
MVLINALTFAGAFAIISIKSFSCMPKDPTESLSKYLISIFHQLAPLLSSFKDTILSYETSISQKAE